MKRVLPLLCALLSITASAQTDAEINAFMDAWHAAAARADAQLFFGSMAEESVYIGTDDHERWNKKEFMSFAMPYFEKGKAWDFKPYDRHIHVGDGGRVVWFSELLNTWMGVCRGSGVIVRTNGRWKIKQYHLSVTVPNEIIRDFIQLVDAYHLKDKK